MWDDIKDKKPKPSMLEMEEELNEFETPSMLEMNEELAEYETSPSVMLEQSYLNKVASDFLKHPSSEKISESVNLMSDYTYLGLLRNTIAPSFSVMTLTWSGTTTPSVR